MMHLDFTVDKYTQLCNTISNSGFVPIIFSDYFLKNKPSKFILIRHDVDIKPERALKISRVENEFNIKSTYYFRMTPKVFNPDIIRKICDLGHEIGFHYEVLDKTKGNYDKGIELFKKELEKFRNVCDIKTICMHGYPLTPWKNSDIWRHYDFREFGIVGEAYLSIDYSDVNYFSDTGRTWDGERYRIKDVIDNKNLSSINIKSTDELIKLIIEERINRMCILAHPGQWNDNYSSWVTTWLIRSIKNNIKNHIIRRWLKSYHV